MAEEIVTEIIVDARQAKQGITDYTEALTHAGEATDKFGNKIGASFSSAERAANAYLAKLDPVFAASQAIGRETTTVATAIDGLERQLMRGSVTTGQYNERMALLAGRMATVKAASNDLATGTITASAAMAKLSVQATAHSAALGQVERGSKAAGFAARDLGLQSIDMFQAIATGQPILRSLIQQGAQVAQVNAAMGVSFKQTAAAAVGFIGGLLTNPLIVFGAAIAAVGAALIGFAGFAENAARKNADLRNQLSASKDSYVVLAKDVEEAARRVSAATSASRDDATKAALALASMKQFSGGADNLTALTMTAQGLSHVLGIDIPAAAKKMVDGMQEPAKVALQLASGATPLRTLDAALLATIVHLEQHGKRAEAAALLQDAFAKSARAAADNLTPLQKALNELSTELHDLIDPTNQFGKSLGETITGAAASAIRDVTAAIKELKGLVSGAPQEGGPTTRAEAVGSLLTGGIMDSIRAMRFLADEIAGSARSSGLAPGTTVRGSPAYPDALAGQINTAAGAFNLDAAFLTALQRSENRAINGQWPDSPTGAIGAMQMTGSTFRGIQSQPGNYPMTAALGPNASIREQGQNVFVGGEHAAYLLRKYNSVELAVLAWHDGEPRIDQFLKGIGQPSPEARAQADLILSQYQGSGFKMAAGNTGTAQFGPGMPTAQQLGFGQRATEGVQIASDIESQSRTVAKLTEELGKLEDAKTAIRMQPTISDNDRNILADYDLKTAKLNEDLQNALNPLRQSTSEIHDQAAATLVLGEADRKILATRQEIARQRAANPTVGISDAAESAKIAQVTAQLTAQYIVQGKEIQKTIDEQDKLADSWKGGAESAAHAAAAQKAYNDIIATTASDSPEFNARLEERTKLYEQQAAGLQHIQANQESFSNQHQIEMLHAEIDTLGMASNERQLYLKHLQDEFDLKQKFPGEANDPYRKTLLAERDALAQLTQLRDTAQRNLDLLAGMFQSAFDTISNSITEAFVNGNAAAINWGNVMKGVLSQVIKAFLQLAVMNPIMNSLFGGMGGQLLPTLGGVMGGGIMGGGGGGGDSGMMQSGLGMIGVGNQLSGGALTNSMGLTGQGGIVTGFLNTPVFGGTSAGQFGPVTSGLAEGGVGLPVTGAATIGQLAGGVGGGFALGSMAGGALQSSLNKTGPAPQIGAGAGALAGAMVGTFIFPGLGTIAGGLLGGLIGGLGGGAIGPRPASPFSSIGLSIGPGGSLQAGDLKSQGTDAQALATNTYQNTQWLNAVMGAHGVSLSSLNTVGAIGSNTPGGNQAAYKAADFAAAFPQLRFGMEGPGGAAYTGRSFKDVQQLSDVSVAIEQFVATLQSTNASDRIGDFLNTLGDVATADIPAKLAGITTFITETVPQLLGENKLGSLGDAISQINKTFGPAIAMAHDLAFKEAELTAARDKAVESARDAVLSQEAINTQSLRVRYANAVAQVTGDQSQVLPAQLTAFDMAARQQRLQLAAHLTDTFGPAFDQTKDFADQMALLEMTLGEERLAVVKQFNAQIVDNTQASAAQAAAAAAAAAKQIADAQHQMRAASTNLDVRFYQAQAVLNPAAAKAASDYAFAVQQETERRDFAKNLIDTWGESFRATQDFADAMAGLERTLGEERLAAQKQFNDQALQTATGTITSLADYARSLQFSGASPLSPQAQYGSALSEFNAVSGAAVAGDFASIQKLQSFSDSFLTASRGVYGSGAGYAADFQRVEDALKAVGSISPETLTASVYQFEMRSQTQQLVDSQKSLGDILKDIKLAMEQGKGAPARAA